MLRLWRKDHNKVTYHDIIANYEKINAFRNFSSFEGKILRVFPHPPRDKSPSLPSPYFEKVPFTPLPIDRISIQDIKALKTVVYDDDRIPHTEVIDSAAQALQLEFIWMSKECTCLFRRMRKVRPIDWYHSIQQRRLKPTN